MKYKRLLWLVLPILSLVGSLVTHSNDVSEAKADTSEYTYTFQNGDITSSTTNVTLGGVAWSINSGVPTTFNNYYGLELGGSTYSWSSYWSMSAPISEFGVNKAIKEVSLLIGAGSYPYYYRIGTTYSNSGQVEAKNSSQVNKSYSLSNPSNQGNVVIEVRGKTIGYIDIKSITISLVDIVTITADGSNHSDITLNNDIPSKVRYNYQENYTCSYDSVPGDIISIVSDGDTFVSSSYIDNGSGDLISNNQVAVSGMRYFYSTSNGPITISYVPDSDININNFMDYYLHINDYNSNEGLCVNYYETLNEQYSKLTESQKGVLSSNERYLRWKSVVESNNTPKSLSVVDSSINSDNTLLIVVTITISILSICSSLFFIKRKKR